MIPPKVQKWLEANIVPQRILLSGAKGGFEVALHVASRLQQMPPETIEKGIHPDTIVFRDKGKSFKIDFSDAAKRDEQGEFENVRGLIRWSHQKPTANHRIAILENFERVSRESPHALLKLIEEPPVKTVLLFTTRNHHQMLDTVISRMTVVRLTQEPQQMPSLSQTSQDFLNAKTLTERFRVIEELDKQIKEEKNKALALQFLEELIQHTRTNQTPSRSLETLWETHQDLKANLNTRFTLEKLVLKET